MINKLRRKFIISAMCAVVSVLFVIMAAIQISSYVKIVKNADETLQFLTENNGRFPLRDKPVGGFFKERMPFSPETPYETRYFSVRLNEQGAVTASDTGFIAAITSSDAIEYATQIYAKGSTRGFKKNYRYHTVKGNSETLILFLDCSRDLANFNNFFKISLLVSAAGILAVLVLVLLLSKTVVKPLAESYEKQKQFITDASHELKTPLTIIAANTEVLEMENGENEWTASINKQVSRLSTLTNQLVTLTRMEEGERRLQMAEFCISDAVADVAGPFVALAENTGKTFTLMIEPVLSCNGHEASIRQLVTLLLDNAVKYTDDGGCINLLLERQGKRSTLTVYNTTDNIEKGNQDKLFTRFYRADPSRSSAVPGYGIGLSVAQAIVEAHNGKIHAESIDGRSLQITVTL